MKACWLLCVVLAHILTCHGQQNVVVSVASYLDNFNGGSATTTCRPADELSFGGPSQLTCQARSYAVPPRSQGRWGTPSGGTQKSGLGFEGVQGKTVALNTDFFLGNMVHFNYPILQGSAASGVRLNIFFTVTTTSGQSIGTYLYNFDMQIDETLNQAPCAYPSQAGNPCADKIFFGNTLNADTSFTLGQVDYTLQLRGFKESNSSSSSPVQYFISNEQQSSTAYLFARITAACPRTCVNGGAYVLSSSNECVCDCSNVNCPYTAQVTSPNCTCVCPNPTQCQNGAGGILKPDCTCQCQSCPSPLLTNPADCSCSCPTNYCGTGTINNPNTCSCNCPNSPCPIANEIRDGRCNCVCNLTCQSPKIENPSSSVCGCVCPSTTCPSGYTINPNTCACECTRTCVNAPLITSSCTCGPCVGNWTLAPNNTCTLCKLNSTSCKPGEGVDAATCTCVCSQLQCDLYNDGQVVDQTRYCTCRPCVAGECICGNGIVEPGEDCDVAGNPCCQQCKWTTAPCTDNNGCTQSDTCNGAGVCIGEYKCPPSNDCANITCNPAVGTCVTNAFPDNSNCGATPYDLCSRRCVSGVCQNTPIVCDPDNNLEDCMIPVCNPLTGTCPYVPVTDPTFGCSDDDSCTTNDHCVNGTCQGSPVVCPPSTDPCKTYVCTDNLCQAVGLSNIPCNADNSSCTAGDYCFQGTCLTGPMKNCTGGDQCKSIYCDAADGECKFLFLNTTCNDGNVCTTNDTCTSGTCAGVTDPAYVNAVECGAPPPVTPEEVNNTSALIFGLTGAAALIGAIAGIAFLVKKIRDSKLLDPETWDPDKFSSVGSNPLYKGSEKTVDNRMYEGSM